MKYFLLSILIIFSSCKLGGPIFSTNENDMVHQAAKHDSYAYDEKYDVKEGVQRVKRDELYGYHDRKGNLIIPVIYTDANDFSEDLACVQKNEQYGFINKAGETVIPFKFDKANSFKNGLAKVAVRGLTFNIDLDGKCYSDCPDADIMKRLGIK